LSRDPQTIGLILGEMFYQLSWTTLPGLRGLSCSEFRATPTASPDTGRGVAFECASETERAALAAELEAHFGPLRFLNTAAAFDAVKDYVALRATRR
jgi:hypothetical protein